LITYIDQAKDTKKKTTKNTQIHL